MARNRLPGRNAKCPCGSGKRFRKCHRGWYTGRGEFPLPGHPGVKVRIDRVRASMVTKGASALPERLLFYARYAVQEASKPEAHEYQGVVALMLVATAGEAIVNRLLEPLMPGPDWEKFERKQPGEKWQRLSEMIGMSPGLSKGAPPLQPYLELVRLRNDLAHFKHGKSMSTEEVEFPASWAAGMLRADLTRPLGPANVQSAEVDLHPEIEPARAKEHYAKLQALLVPVLDKHPSDEFGIVDRLKEMLTLARDQKPRPWWRRVLAPSNWTSNGRSA